MNTNLTIGSTTKGKFGLPLDAVTQTFAILAKKGMGKSYTASVIAEEMLKAEQHIIAIDPTGAWWGLQSSSDGKSEGFPIVVFGGDHANLPLEENAGEMVAQAIVEKKFSAIIDLSSFRKGVANRFVGAFLEKLYHINREPLHLIVDEADSFAPQRTFGDDARTLGAMEDIVRRGRIRGIGCTLITQRPQIINKNVLTQVETLITLGLSHPKDINAIMEWIDVHADPAEAKVMVESLPSMTKGNAWFWSPSWGDFFDRVKVRPRETFDSGATPKPGEKVRKPSKLAPIDIQALGAAIAETVERKKAEDPKELRKKIAELQKELQKEQQKKAVPAKAVVDTTAIQSAVVKAVADRDREWATVLRTETASIIEVAKNLATVKPGAPNIVVPKQDIPRQISAPARVISSRPEPVRNGDLTLPQQRIIDALAWLDACRIKMPNRNIVAYLADQSPTSSGFANNLGSLRTAGLVDYPSSGKVVLTPNGMASANAVDVPLTPEELHSAIYSKLPTPQCNILKVLVAEYPKEIERIYLAEASGQSPTSSGFANNLGALRSLGLIEYPKQGYVVGKPMLFLED